MPTVFNEGRHAAEFLMFEQGITYSRDNITIASGAGELAAGTVLGRNTVGAATRAAKAGGNTGNGTMSTVTMLPGGKAGIYVVRFTAATAFTVEDPDGFVKGSGVTGTQFADDVQFTITAGGTPFIAGDGFDITVAAGDMKYVASPATGATGAQTASAVLLYPVDATSTDVRVAAILRGAEVNGNLLAYATSVDDAPKRAAKAAQLAAVGIIVR